MESNLLMLTADQGNSFLKLELWKGTDFIRGERFRSGECERALRWAADCGASQGALCSVGKMDSRFLESLRRTLGGDLMVLTHSTPLPFEVDYEPGCLGTDRIAAAAGARALGLEDPLLVVDAGTAITADLLDARGNFQGGSISPGIAMRLRALGAGTAALPSLEGEGGKCDSLGTTTRGSLLSGCQWGAACEIAGRFQHLRQTRGAQRIVLTGGDAPVLMGLLGELGLRSVATLEPVLVGRGLVEIFNSLSES